MNCPKCGAEQPDGTEICARCGIVFRKYYKYHPKEGEKPRVRLQPASEETGLKARVLPEAVPGDAWTFWLRAGLLLVLFFWGWKLILTPMTSGAIWNSLLHGANLAFHEFGHLLFRPFGTFMTSLGGTLGQLLMPLICLWVFLFQTRDPFAGAVALWWFGENFLDIAPYMNDARAGVLPLTGGRFGRTAPYGVHDWEYLFTETGLLSLDHAIARFTQALGALLMLLAIAWGAALLYRQYRQLWG